MHLAGPGTPNRAPLTAPTFPGGRQGCAAVHLEPPQKGLAGTGALLRPLART